MQKTEPTVTKKRITLHLPIVLVSAVTEHIEENEIDIKPMAYIRYLITSHHEKPKSKEHDVAQNIYNRLIYQKEPSDYYTITTSNPLLIDSKIRTLRLVRALVANQIKIPRYFDGVNELVIG